MRVYCLKYPEIAGPWVLRPRKLDRPPCAGRSNSNESQQKIDRLWRALVRHENQLICFLKHFKKESCHSKQLRNLLAPPDQLFEAGESS